MKSISASYTSVICVNHGSSMQVDKKLLNTVKGSIKQGFSWAAREGPLCEERKCVHFFWFCF